MYLVQCPGQPITWGGDRAPASWLLLSMGATSIRLSQGCFCPAAPSIAMLPPPPWASTDVCLAPWCAHSALLPARNITASNGWLFSAGLAQWLIHPALPMELGPKCHGVAPWASRGTPVWCPHLLWAFLMLPVKQSCMWDLQDQSLCFHMVIPTYSDFVCFFRVLGEQFDHVECSTREQAALLASKRVQCLLFLYFAHFKVSQFVSPSKFLP